MARYTTENIIIPSIVKLKIFKNIEGKAVFPDFMNDRTKKWWIDEIKNHYDKVLTFDG